MNRRIKVINGVKFIWITPLEEKKDDKDEVVVNDTLITNFLGKNLTAIELGEYSLVKV